MKITADGPTLVLLLIFDKIICDAESACFYKKTLAFLPNL